jgi:hypothetical protein
VRKEVCEPLDLPPQEQRVLLRLVFLDGHTESDSAVSLGSPGNAEESRKEGADSAFSSFPGFLSDNSATRPANCPSRRRAWLSSLACLTQLARNIFAAWTAVVQVPWYARPHDNNAFRSARGRSQSSATTQLHMPAPAAFISPSQILHPLPGRHRRYSLRRSSSE